MKHTQNYRGLHLLIGGLSLLSVSTLAIQSSHAQQIAAYSGDVASYGASAPAQSQATNAARKPVKRATVAAVATATAASAPLAPSNAATSNAATSNAMASTAPSAAAVSVSGDSKPASASRKPAVSAGKGPYYVDFRARTAASYGHAFVWFGKTGEKKVDVAGLHPKGDEAEYMLGHLTWVPADTGASYGDLDEQYLTANYRVYLSEADAKIVFAHIRHLQATSHFWNAQTNNCTGFIGKIASFMGLKTPFHLVWPENYVKQMKEMNGGRTTVQISAPSQASLF